MSRYDVTDVHPVSRAELDKDADNASTRLGTYIYPTVKNLLRQELSDAFTEGVIAGLRVSEREAMEPGTPAGEATLRLYGPIDDLARVRPMFCYCDPRSGSVCSVRRRPATCPTVERLGDE